MGFFAPSGILNRRGLFGSSPSFSPADVSGLELWVSADYGITKGVSFINQLELVDFNPSSSDGTYTRSSGGTTLFASNDNNIAWDGTGWYVYDASLDDITFVNYNFDFSGDWEVVNGTEVGSVTSSTSSDPDAVSEVLDKSGNLNNLTNSIATYISNNIINGKPAFNFDGGRLVGTDIVTGKTLYAVIKTKSTLPSQYACILELTGGGLYSAILGTARWGSYFSTEVAVDTGLSANTAYIIGSLSDTSGGGTSYKFRQNGSQVKSGTSDEYYSRSSLYFGNDGSGGQIANCYVSEAIVYNREVTTGEAQKIESYLNSKYAIY